MNIIRIKPVIQEAIDNTHLLNPADYGYGTITPGTVEAGVTTCFTITYTAGKKGIKEGSGISVKTPHWPGWSEPNNIRGKQGFTQVESDGKIKLSVKFGSSGHRGSGWIIVKIRKGTLKRGQHIYIYFGGKSRNAPGVCVQNYDTADKIQFYISYGLNAVPEYSKVYIFDPRHPGYSIIANRLKKEPGVKINGGPAAVPVAVLPTTAGTKEVIALKLILMDQYQNAASGIREKENLVLSGLRWDNGLPVCDNKNKRIDTVILKNRIPYKKELKIRAPLAKGIYYLSFIWNNRRYLANPVVVGNAPKKKIYWAELHAQGVFSDGVGTPETYFTRARDIYNMDVAALTDHSDGMVFPVIEANNKYYDKKCEHLCRTTKRLNQEGSFITIPATELSSDVKKYPGGKDRNHRNLYFLKEGEFTCFNWREFPDTEDWFRFCENTEYMIIPHTHKWGLDCRYHNPSVERVIEIKSDKGSGEYFHVPGISPTKDHGGVFEFLRRGYRVGFAGGGDYHQNIPGRHYPVSIKNGLKGEETSLSGYAAIIAPSLTRKNIWKGIYNRDTYATTGVRIYLDFSMLCRGKQTSMSREKVIDRKKSAARKFRLKYALTAPIKKIELIRNGNTKRPVSVYKPGKTPGIKDGFNKKLYTGDIMLSDNMDIRKLWLNAFYPPMIPHKFIYYFIKIHQVDGEIAWSSPIWLSDKPVLPL